MTKRNHSIYQPTKSGFTIVELLLSMSVLGLLLITIAVVTMNVLAIYQKGLTVKSINEVGRQLGEEFTTTINGAPLFNINELCAQATSGRGTSLTGDDLEARRASAVAACLADNAKNVVFQNNTGYVDGQTVQYSGIFCAGNYSYIWKTNYGKDDHLSLTYLDQSGGTHTISDFRLLKVSDRLHVVCESMIGDGADLYKSKLNRNSNINITVAANYGTSNPIAAPESNFLEKSNVNLDLYELTIFPISQDSLSLRTFISGSYVLATPDNGSPSVTRSGDYCNPGDVTTLSSDFNYCGINKFSFAARTAGR